MQKDYSQPLKSVDYYVHPTYQPLPIRVDLYLKKRLPNRSRNQNQKLFKEKRVLVDSRPVVGSYRLRGGEQLRVLLKHDLEYTASEDIALDILYEDEDIIAVNKQPGVMMHPAGTVLSGTLLNAIHYYYEQQKSDIRPSLLQRLDKHTSGLVLMAKNSNAHQGIQKQITSHRIEKIYLAFCHDIPKEANAIINEPIGEVEHPFVKKMGVYHGEGSKSSLTQYTTLISSKQGSLLGIKLHTGRQHQIRVHLAYCGHPLYGDLLYGGKPLIERQALHSYFLRFEHPVQKKQVELLAPLPIDICELLSNEFSDDSQANVLNSNGHKLDMSCISQIWNPRIWIDNFRKS